jgi:hypothetical protein
MLASLYAAAGANENRGSNYPKRTGRRGAPINHPAIHFGDNLWATKPALALIDCGLSLPTARRDARIPIPVSSLSAKSIRPPSCPDGRAIVKQTIRFPPLPAETL